MVGDEKNNAADSPEKEEPSLADAMQKIADLQKIIDEKLVQLTPSGSLEKFGGALTTFFSSGLFYMIFGSALLYFSRASLTEVHPSFSFVLIVLAVAILLYGTGTQSAGSLESKDENLGKYNVIIAGGAGALAMLIGWGMVYFSKDLPNVFGLEKKRMFVNFSPIVSDLQGTHLRDIYFADFEDDQGTPLPYTVEGNNFRVIIPYFEENLGKAKPIGIHYNLYLRPGVQDHTSCKKGLCNFLDTVPGSTDITLDKDHLASNNAVDFALYNPCGAGTCKSQTEQLPSLLNPQSALSAPIAKAPPDIQQQNITAAVPDALRGGGEVQ